MARLSHIPFYKSRRDEDADSSSSLTTHPGVACIAGGHRDNGRLRFPPTEPTYEAATVLCIKSFRSRVET